MIRRALTALVCVVVGLAVPYGLNAYWIHVADVMLVFGILAIGLCLTLGVAGQINLAQVAFFGVGAYTSGVLTTQSGLGFWIAGVLAVLAAALVGLLVGIPALRVQSHYLGIVTLGLAVGFINLVTNLGVTGSAQGITGLPVPPLLGIDLSDEYLYYYVELVVLVLCLAWALFLVHTRLGRRLRAMRDDHLAAACVGAEIPLLRMTAFVLGGVYGGIAGVLYAGLIRFVSPDSFSIAEMFLVLAMVVIGGRFSVVGSLVGAFILLLLREWLSDYANYAQLGYGALVVGMVVFAPTGLAGVPRRLGRLLARRRAEDEQARATARPYVRSSAEAGGRAAGGHEPCLRVEGIDKRFKGLTALEGVDLVVREGEIRGVVGPNGSGKTTLFNVISGLYTPDGGVVTLFGRDVTGARPYRLSRWGLARTFQNLRLFGRATVRDNVLVALDRTRLGWAWRYLLWPLGVARSERRLRGDVDAMLEAFGLSAVAGAMPGALPYGTQRRVEIARAMASRPRLLLLDEPAAGLNGDEIRQLADVVRAIRDGGVTVVVIEHNMGLVMSLCDRVTVLNLGRVIADGRPAEVARDSAVVEAYLGGSAQELSLGTEAVR